jgi:hypothetical protein
LTLASIILATAALNLILGVFDNFFYDSCSRTSPA